ncbi:hypothetical protein CKF46_37365, partial [Klebsiella pneumoniae]
WILREHGSGTGRLSITFCCRICRLFHLGMELGNSEAIKVDPARAWLRHREIVDYVLLSHLPAVSSGHGAG